MLRVGRGVHAGELLPRQSSPQGHLLLGASGRMLRTWHAAEVCFGRLSDLCGWVLGIYALHSPENLPPCLCRLLPASPPGVSLNVGCEWIFGNCPYSESSYL